MGEQICTNCGHVIAVDKNGWAELHGNCTRKPHRCSSCGQECDCPTIAGTMTHHCICVGESAPVLIHFGRAQ